MNKSIHTFVVLAYKKSKYLEECICSVLEQNYKSSVVIATSTPNDYIEKIAKKYQLDIIINPNAGKGIGYDFDFARNCVNTTLVTVAHQDDIYDKDYSQNIVSMYMKYQDALILFSDYYEVRNRKKVYKNINLFIKRLLLFPLKFNSMSEKKIIKRSVLALGNAICCPAVTYVNENIREKRIFPNNLRCNVDWKAWETLSLKKGKFLYINKPLMGHRVHEESTTSEIIHNNIRTKEDIEILECFWPRKLACIIAKIYALSEKSNEN